MANKISTIANCSLKIKTYRHYDTLPNVTVGMAPLGG